jgi:hypothetical protein
MWLPGYEGIAENETANHLARTGSEHPFTGPEPACGISFGVAKREVNDWMNKKKNIKQLGSSVGLKQAKELILGPSAKRSRDLLKLNRGTLRWMVKLFTGHCHLKRYLFRLELYDDLICERCLEEDEPATHVLCDSKAVAHSCRPVFYGAG